MLAVILVILALRAGPNDAADVAPGPDGVLGRRVLGAMLQYDDICLVLGERTLGSGRERFRFLRVSRTGRVLEDPVLQEATDLGAGYTAMQYDGSLALAWVEGGHELRVAVPAKGAVHKRVLLTGDSRKGTLGSPQILNVSGRLKMILTQHRYVKEKGGQEQTDKQYLWLCSYDMVDGGLRFAAATCIEDDESRSATVRCASLGESIIVWQATGTPGSMVQTVRSAVWEEPGELTWNSYYVGNDMLNLFVDPSFGATCLVQEWKNPNDVSGIYCFLRSQANDIAPASSFGKGMVATAFRRLRANGQTCWALVREDQGTVLVQYFSQDLSPIGSDRISAKGVNDIALVTEQAEAYVALVYAHSVSVAQLRPCAGVATTRSQLAVPTATRATECENQ